MVAGDLNGDKVSDVVFSNEGQESAVLLGPDGAVETVGTVFRIEGAEGDVELM